MAVQILTSGLEIIPYDIVTPFQGFWPWDVVEWRWLSFPWIPLRVTNFARNVVDEICRVCYCPQPKSWSWNPPRFVVFSFFECEDTSIAIRLVFLNAGDRTSPRELYSRSWDGYLVGQKKSANLCKSVAFIMSHECFKNYDSQGC